jgi:hypothetical protein
MGWWGTGDGKGQHGAKHHPKHCNTQVSNPCWKVMETVFLGPRFRIVQV